MKTMEHPEGGTRWTLEHVRNSLAIPVIEALPMNYVSVMKDWPKNWKPGEPPKELRFTLKAPIPKLLLFKILERLKIWNPIEKDEEPDSFTGT